MSETDKLSLNVKARELANDVVELGCTLAREEGLAEHPESVRRMWQYVMEIAGQLIGDKVVEPKEKKGSLPIPDYFDGGLINEDAPSDDEPFPFGKFGPEQQGKTYGEVPDYYYKWLSQQDWLEKWPDVVDYIEQNGLG